jgi:hypothetical protein
MAWDYGPVVNAWAAGLFEGEGTIYLDRSRDKRGNGRVRLALALSSTDLDVIRRFRTAVDCGTVVGPYTPTKGVKPYWTWRVRRERDALLLIERFRPLLGERRLARLSELLAERDLNHSTYVVRQRQRIHAGTDQMVLS